MINSIKIKNFLSHKKTKIKFSKGVNVIAGQSEAGKSAIGRAINWVINNRPLGNSFHSHWSNNTSVTLQINKSKIKRTKSKNKNSYYLNGSKFSAFGSKIPKEIKGTIKFSEINIQRQFTLPFLFSLSSGEVSKYINKIVDIDSIDKVTSDINRILLDEKRQYENEKDNLRNTKEALKAYSWIQNAERDLVVLESLQKKIEKYKNQIEHVKNYIQLIEKENKELDKIKHLSNLDKSELYKRIISHFKTIEKEKRVLLNIERLNASISVLRRKNSILKSFINRKESFLTKKLKSCPLCGRKEEKNE